MGRILRLLSLSRGEAGIFGTGIGFVLSSPGRGGGEKCGIQNLKQTTDNRGWQASIEIGIRWKPSGLACLPVHRLERDFFPPPFPRAGMEKK
jgi:hypothetical protein